MKSLPAFLPAFLCSVAVSYASGNLLDNGDPLSGDRGWRGVLAVEPDVDGRAAFEVGPKLALISRTPIPVEAGKTYLLSCWFKPKEGQTKLPYVGVQCLDQNQEAIPSSAVTVEEGTETTLVDSVTVGDESIKVRDASNWKLRDLIRTHGAVAFHADPSGRLDDLPNRNLSPAGIRAIRRDGDAWIVELASPMEMAYPADTVVRLHRSGWGSTWINYNTRDNPEPGWQKIEGLVGGSGGLEAQSFWPGTHYVNVVVNGVGYVGEVGFSKVD